MKIPESPRAAVPVPREAPPIPSVWLHARYVIDGNGCWIWSGPIVNGYGSLSYKGCVYTASRAYYTNLVGLIPPGLVLDHLCRVKRCVNPDHLEPVTTQVNTARGVGPTAEYTAAWLRGECINGHVLAEVGFHSSGPRVRATCAQCGRDRVRAYKERNRELVRERDRQYKQKKRLAS